MPFGPCLVVLQGKRKTTITPITTCPAFHEERTNAFRVRYDLEEGDLASIKFKDFVRFLKEKRVQLIENIAEYPLLFAEDYNNYQHELLDVIANHENTSFSSRHNLEDNDDESDKPPPAKRQDRRDSMERSLVNARVGVG